MGTKTASPLFTPRTPYSNSRSETPGARARSRAEAYALPASIFSFLFPLSGH